ncbi:glucose/ribitol short chain dehydrogenase/reductase family protein [Crocosphaera subtropica ATCC 51142]|uniref:Glucose/ribitol short chain dehydrogenase/reductase family protein n=1 Tax=Crocosphaera subtropica (strain ATCC 51142 / BH68) TaxID=43989 RepID=B1X274_CROS5|nr:SDR family NAD(P)-dependent oxidoreductase [Crocosphaera subtropica]ACB54235.1 glucose/ribitol short chain dehydrogenase/reductase family protein [Crocosphaera subtropica ATCC 51142]
MRTVIISGANNGLGYACAKELALNKDIYLVLACRDNEKATKAVEKLKNTTKNNQIEYICLDLASLQSVRQFEAKFAQKNLPPLGIIICNAGVQFIQRRTYTDDGMETTFAVNHLGHFLLVNLLLKHLKPPGRIIFVSSDTHDPSKITGMPPPNFQDPNLLARPELDPTLKDKGVSDLGRIAYTTSKLCNILCAYELSRRLDKQRLSTEEHPITVNVFTPGLMPGTGLAQDYPPLAKIVWDYILPLFSFFPKINTPQQSGRALARLVEDPQLKNVTGKYFSGLQMIESSQESYDVEKAQQLWDKSVELVGLRKDKLIVQ